MSRYVMPLVVLVLGLVAACSDGVAAAPPQPRPMGPELSEPQPPEPQAWLSDVCTALAPAVRATEPVPEVRLDDLLGTRERMLAYLEQRILAYDAAADGINRAGPAPVEAGQSVTEPVVRVLRARSEELAGLREDLRTVPEVADQTLADTLQRVRGSLALAGPTLTLFDLALPPSLTAQAATVPACRALVAGAPG